MSDEEWTAQGPHQAFVQDATAFSAAIRARRRALGLTQKDVALVSGLGRVAVLRLENEPERCQLQTALAAARALGLRTSMRIGATPQAERDATGYGALPHEAGAAGAGGDGAGSDAPS